MDDYLQKSRQEFATDKAMRDAATALKRYRDLIREFKASARHSNFCVFTRDLVFTCDCGLDELIARADEILGEE